MAKLTNKEIKQLLKQHPHWRIVNAVFAIAVVLYLSKLVVSPDLREMVGSAALVMIGAGFIYLFKMRRDVKKAHEAQSTK